MFEKRFMLIDGERFKGSLESDNYYVQCFPMLVTFRKLFLDVTFGVAKNIVSRLCTGKHFI